MSISTINNGRDNGEGLIRQRSDGRYEYRYVAGKEPDGKFI